MLAPSEHPDGNPRVPVFFASGSVGEYKYLYVVNYDKYMKIYKQH